MWQMLTFQNKNINKIVSCDHNLNIWRVGIAPADTAPLHIALPMQRRRYSAAKNSTTDTAPAEKLRQI